MNQTKISSAVVQQALENIRDGINALQGLGIRTSTEIIESFGVPKQQHVELTVLSPDNRKLAKFAIKVSAIGDVEEINTHSPDYRREKLIDDFAQVIQAEIDSYNRKCAWGFELTMEEVLKYLKRKIK